MPRTITESDWKIFRGIRQVALDRSCEKVLREVNAIAADTSKTSHERYLEIYKTVQARDKELSTAFDDLRRSTAFMQLGIIYSRGLVNEEELLKFTPELYQQIKELFPR